MCVLVVTSQTSLQGMANSDISVSRNRFSFFILGHTRVAIFTDYIGTTMSVCPNFMPSLMPATHSTCSLMQSMGIRLISVLSPKIVLHFPTFGHSTSLLDLFLS